VTFFDGAMDRDNVICCSRRTAHAKNWFANQVQVQLKDMSSGGATLSGSGLT
jgi:hypothetical protein